MQYQQTPQGLTDLYTAPVAAAPQAMQLLGQQQAADQMTQADQARELNYNYQNDPLKLQEHSLQNQGLEAGLPGIGARAQMDVRKNRLESATEPQALRDLQGKYSSAELKRHIDDLENFGTIAQSAAAQIRMNPLGGVGLAKQALINSGHGDMWNPDWDAPDADIGGIAAKLARYGTDVQDAMPALRKAFGTQALKNEGSRGIAELKAGSAERIQQMKGEVQAQTNAMKERLGNIPKNWGMYAAHLTQMAAMEQDPDRKRALMEEAFKAQQEMERLTTLQAQVNVGPKVDIPGMTKGAIPNMAGSQAPPPGNPYAPNAGKAAPGAVPQDLPQGTTANPDGTFTLPNGKIVRKKQ